jgi:hypothetical protein
LIDKLWTDTQMNKWDKQTHTHTYENVRQTDRHKDGQKDRDIQRDRLTELDGQIETDVQTDRLT